MPLTLQLKKPINELTMKKVKIDRRQFIKVSSMSGTALTIGFLFPGLKSLAQLTEKDCEFFQPSAFLKIDKSGQITIFFARQEMGQGVNTSLPMLVAEELEADFKNIKVEIVEFGTFPLGKSDFGNPHDTGGSQSTPESWTLMRKAGATAKTMLIAAAAKEWGIKPEQCAADKGTVVNTVTMATKNYGDLVCQAAEMPMPQEVTLKNIKDFKVIGKEQRKTNLKDTLTGRVKFGMDVKVPGMVYAVVERCPVMGGKLVSVDDAAALKVPGVIKIVSYEGTGAPMNVYSGVAVIASNSWAAIKARKLLKIKWDEGVYNKDNTADLFKKFAAKAKGKPEKEVVKKQDAPKAVIPATNIVTATYSGPLLAHAAIEPINCIAEIKEGKCEIWAGLQLPDWAVNTIAKDCNIAHKDIKVNLSLIGGGFGRRLRCDHAIEAIKIAKQIDKPVKLLWERGDDFRFEAYRPANYHYLKGGWDAKGKLMNWEHHVLSTPIATVTWPEEKDVSENGGGANDEFWYDIPNINTGYSKERFNINRSWLRGVENATNVFAIEAFVDEIAKKMKKDPLEFRLSLLESDAAGPGKRDWSKYRQRVAGTLKLAAEKIGYASARQKNHFIGLACHAYPGTNAYASHAIEIELLGPKKFRIKKVIAAIDCGVVINPDGLKSQMEGGIAFGLGQTLKDEITVKNSRVEQDNFRAYPLLRFNEMPPVEVYWVQSTETPGGVGEVGVSTVGPALCNALAAAGYRPRNQPIKNEGFVWETA
jgi:isoquinoline 1-oxidoreductase subunit beta